MAEMYIDPDDPPSVESQPLAGEELRIKAHWERFQPMLVADLRRQEPGDLALDRAIRRKYWAQEYSAMKLQADNPGMDPGQATMIAAELHQDALYPPQETPRTRVRSRPTTSTPPSD